MVAAGAAGVLFCTLGNSNSFGIYQAYYMSHMLPGESPDRIAWIGGVQSFLTFAAGFVGGPLFDRYGAWVSSGHILRHLASLLSAIAGRTANVCSWSSAPRSCFTSSPSS